MELAGAKVVITGGTRGLGRTFAVSLKQQGAVPYVICSTPESLKNFHDETGIPGKVVNVSNEDEVMRFFEEYAAEYGAPHALINNAGVTADAFFIKKKGDEVARFPFSNWERVVGVNLTGVFLVAREAAYHMVMHGVKGVIINISSICRAGNLGQTNYSASKSAVDAMTVTWSKELSRYGIRVAAIAPGYINTDMVAGVRPDVLEKVIQNIPAGRLGETGEVSQAVQFILTNNFFSGRVLELDGGMRI